MRRFWTSQITFGAVWMLIGCTGYKSSPIDNGQINGRADKTEGIDSETPAEDTGPDEYAVETDTAGEFDMAKADSDANGETDTDTGNDSERNDSESKPEKEEVTTDEEATESTRDSETDSVPVDEGMDTDTDSRQDDICFGYEGDCDGDCVRYVSASGFAGTGTRWSDAFDDIQTAIDDAHCAAQFCDRRCDVWVTKGTYYIFKNSRENSVRLRSHVNLRGGFAGDETDIDERDITGNETILDGRAGPEDARRVYSVVTGANDALLDGFTITGGKTRENFSQGGAGMFNNEVSPTVRHCTFTNNSAPVSKGAAIHNYYSNVVIEDCTFIGNSAETGGAIHNYQSTVVIDRCRFFGNSAEEGGAVFNWGLSSVTLTNSLFAENIAETGGAVCNRTNESVTMTNCTFWGNQGIYGASVSNESTERDIAISNSIFFGNGSYAPIYDEGVSSNVTYSNVEGGFEGDGNIDADPMFCDSSVRDFHLLPGSPCIENGNPDTMPAFDIAGNSRVTADMGAYAFSD